MKNSKKILIYGFEEKVNQNIFSFCEESFLRPPLNYYDISIPLLEKQKIESSYLDNTPFLELFFYKNTSF